MTSICCSGSGCLKILNEKPPGEHLPVVTEVSGHGFSHQTKFA